MDSVFEFVAGIASILVAILLARDLVRNAPSKQEYMRMDAERRMIQDRGLGFGIGFCLMGLAVGVFFILLAFGIVHIAVTAQPTIRP